MNKNNFLLAFVASVALGGCAGSANHKVVRNNPAEDQGLTCQQADAEILRAQSIINAVNEDKDDVSGADIMDGLLWFPFNLIAKASNYSSALNAANQRVVAMKQLKTEKGCAEVQVAEQDARQKNLDTRIRELNGLYKDGLLTEDEYQKQKQKALDSI